MNINTWELYIKYLHDWANSHSEPEFMGESPACYEEWLENDCCDGDCMNCDDYDCPLCENEDA